MRFRNTCLMRGTSTSTGGSPGAYSSTSVIASNAPWRRTMASVCSSTTLTSVICGTNSRCRLKWRRSRTMSRAARFLLDQVELLPHRFARRDALGEVGREAQHARQRVVNLVGDVGGQLADRRELRGLDQLRLGPLELGHLLLDTLVQARVLGRHRRLERDALRQPQLVGREPVVILEPGDRE